MNEELATLNEEVRRGFAEMRQSFAEVHQRLESLDNRVRRDGVLLEAIRDDFHQLAEAHLMFDSQAERHRHENEVAHQEILAFLRTSYRDMDRRVGTLEARQGDTSQG